MATFFSTSNDQRGLAGGGGSDMSFHHQQHYPMSNPYPDASSGGLIPLPATIAHGGRDDDPAAAFMDSRDSGGLQTQLFMGDGGASSAGQRGGQLSLSLGTQQVPVSLYHQYGRPGGMSMNPNQQQQQQQATMSMAMAASRPAPGNMMYVQNSRFLVAARELLDEVVSVRDAIRTKKKGADTDRKEDESAVNGKVEGEENEGSSAAGELSAAERQDLQNKVTALMGMLEQVDRRYRHYHQQMQLVVSSFDAVAGSGAARPYTALALQTISRHFRSLRDAIGAQVQSVRRSLGEQAQDGSGGLSRLRYIDQHLRQQRALQQFGMMQQPQHAWRPQRGLPESAVSVLRAWLFEHFLHPYPKDSEKVMLARQAGLSRGQVSNWFINARVRLWKPMVEEMYKEEFGAEMDSTNSSSENNANGKHGNNGKADEVEAGYSEDRDEFQSPSSNAAAAARHVVGGSQMLNAYKSEPVTGIDAVTLSSLGDPSGMYAQGGLSLSHHGPGGGSLLQDAFAHHGDHDARFVSYGGDMADLGGSVSLTLGLQHCNNNNSNAAGHVPPEQQGLLYGANPGDFDFLNGADDRQRFASSSSQLLHDFVT